MTSRRSGKFKVVSRRLARASSPARFKPRASTRSARPRARAPRSRSTGRASSGRRPPVLARAPAVPAFARRASCPGAASRRSAATAARRRRPPRRRPPRGARAVSYAARGLVRERASVERISAGSMMRLRLRTELDCHRRFSPPRAFVRQSLARVGARGSRLARARRGAGPLRHGAMETSVPCDARHTNALVSSGGRRPAYTRMARRRQPATWAPATPRSPEGGCTSPRGRGAHAAPDARRSRASRADPRRWRCRPPGLASRRRRDRGRQRCSDAVKSWSTPLVRTATVCASTERRTALSAELSTVQPALCVQAGARCEGKVLRMSNSQPVYKRVALSSASGPRRGVARAEAPDRLFLAASITRDWRTKSSSWRGDGRRATTVMFSRPLRSATLQGTGRAAKAATAPANRRPRHAAVE